jgi:septal ring factor EnvC (AmiA/AmiB activator)
VPIRTGVDMNNIEKINDEIAVLRKEGDLICKQHEDLEEQRKKLSERMKKIHQSLYEKTVSLTHINEILRLAKIQFSRLRKLPVETLTQSDIEELNKWIGRAKSDEGLIDIVNALNELEKYEPGQITKNMYALCQKIISGGAYKKNKNN